MAAKSFNIGLEGYWRDVNKGGIPNHSGVYFVYECTYNKEEGTVTIYKLIYIGESEQVRDRIANHEKYDDWMKFVRKNNTLCYSTGSVQAIDRDRVEAAYINKYKPPKNDKNIGDFDKTTINSSGKTALLDTSFTL